MSESDSPATPTPTEVVTRFLAALADHDLDAAMALVDDDIVYTNVGLRPLHGAAATRAFLAKLARPGYGFEVVNHRVLADGPVVVTERTDVIIARGARLQFWVWGRFEVPDGKITVWRDSYDYLDMIKGTARGFAGRVFPRWAPRLPQPSDDPGR